MNYFPFVIAASSFGLLNSYHDFVIGEPRFVGRLFVKALGKPTEILTKLNEMAGFPPNEEIELYEVCYLLIDFFVVFVCFLFFILFLFLFFLFLLLLLLLLLLFLLLFVFFLFFLVEGLIRCFP